jgi:DNA-binding beta-propeller fold protein YncE
MVAQRLRCPAQYDIVVLDLDTLVERELFAGSNAQYVSTGHVVYSVGNTLRAARFDAGNLEASADQIPVLDQVLTKATGGADFDVADDGSLVYVAGSDPSAGRQVVTSFDRQGRVTPLAGIPPGPYRDVRVSPDGRRVAVATFDDVWIFEGEFVAPQTGWRRYDIGPDGRFAIIRNGSADAPDASAPTMVVVQHWAEELKRLAPAK